MAYDQQIANPYWAPRVDYRAQQMLGDRRLSAGWLIYLFSHVGCTTLLFALVAVANRVPIVSAVGNSVFTIAFVFALLSIPVAICVAIWLFVVGVVENPSRRNALAVEVLLIGAQLASVGYFFS